VGSDSHHLTKLNPEKLHRMEELRKTDK
jgi:hypothetical protein